MDHKRIFSSLQQLLEQGHTRREQDVFQAEASSYFSEARFRQELELLERLPVFYDHEFPETLNFRSYKDYKYPLILSRADDGRYHAFPNVCRHRAATLTQECEGKRKSFSCPYHAWTYDLKGEIIAIPEKESFTDCSLEIRRRVPEVERALGGLWLCLRPEERLVPSLKSYFGDLTAELQPAIEHYNTPYLVRRDQYPFNWKFVVDAVLENYHVSTLHHSTFRNVLHGNLGLHERVGLHTRNLYPFKNLRGRAEVNSFRELTETVSFVYHLFPNTVFSIQPAFAAFFTTIPLGPTRCEVRSLYLVPEVIENKEVLERGIELTMKGVKEDHDLLAEVSENLQSACETRVHFGKQEGNLGFFHQNLQRLIQQI